VSNKGDKDRVNEEIFFYSAYIWTVFGQSIAGWIHSHNIFQAKYNR
jgi:hypothetical protein